MSEIMVLSNPRRRRHHKRRRNPESRAERSRAARKGWARRRRRRNPETHAERVRAARAGWRHRRHRRRNPESHYEYVRAAKRGWAHRRRRRNPIGGDIGEVLMPAAFGAAGSIGLNVALGYMTFLPTTLQSGYGRTALQLALAVGIGAYGHKLGMSRKTALSVAAGIGTITLYDLAVPMLQSKFPNLTLGERVGMQYLPAPGTPSGVGMGERVGMNAYLPHGSSTGSTG